jgi:hypothetical protein
MKTKMRAATVVTLLTGMSLTRDEYRGIAKSINVPTGKDKEDTIQNIAKAVENDEVRLAVLMEIKPQYPDPTNPDPSMQPVFVGKQYNYKEPKVLWFMTDTPPPMP